MKRELRKVKGKILDISERLALPVGKKVIIENINTNVAKIYHKSKDGDFYVDNVDDIGRYSADYENINVYDINSCFAK